MKRKSDQVAFEKDSNSISNPISGESIVRSYYERVLLEKEQDYGVPGNEDWDQSWDAYSDWDRDI
jgi:hypothetical protein